MPHSFSGGFYTTTSAPTSGNVTTSVQPIPSTKIKNAGTPVSVGGEYVNNVKTETLDQNKQ